MVEDLLCEILAQPAAERAAALAAIAARCPEHAVTLRRRLRLLDDALPPAPDEASTFGRFELQRRLGGGSADVFLARDPRADRQVVVKILRHPQLLAPATRQGLEHEVLAASRLQHPGIVPVLEFGEHDGCPYVVHPWVDGMSLAEWIAERRPAAAPLSAPDLELVLQWLGQIARALDAAHRQGLVHRDVKPANILLPWRGPACLLDFGLCQEVAALDAGEASEPIGGTLAFMAPELLSPRERPVGPAADIWALGVTLFEAVTGRLPFGAESRHALCLQILTRRPPDPRRWHPGLPRALSRVVGCALAQDAWARYASAAAFADDLERVRRGERVSVASTGSWRRWRQGVRSHRAVVLAGLALVAAVLLPWTGSRAAVPDPDTELLGLGERIRAAQAVAEDLVPGVPAQIDALAAWLREHGVPLTGLLPRVQERRLHREQTEPDAAATQVLQQVAVELQQFAHGTHGTVGQVQERLVWARLAAERAAASAPAWQLASAAVAADPRYAGLRLTPQVDLMPLGPDPDSGLQEFYHPRSAWSAKPVTRDPGTRRLRLHEGAGLVFVLLPPRRVLIGYQARDPALPRFDAGASVYADPEWVRLDAFFLSKYEMTQAQWWQLTGEEPSHHRRGRVLGADPPIGWSHPVEQVSATRCDAVLRAFGLWLPTEAQWEYAAGCGAPTPWYFGDDPRELVHHGNMQDRRYWTVNLGGTSAIDGDDGFGGPAPVGRFAANPFGLHDVLGNVGEWCRDRWGSYAEWPAAPGDGLRSPLPLDRERAYRGGSFAEHPLRRGKTSSRQNAVPDACERYLGLRPARPLREDR